MNFGTDGKTFPISIPYGKPHEQFKKAVKMLNAKLGDTIFAQQSAIAGTLKITVDKGML